MTPIDSQEALGIEATGDADVIFGDSEGTFFAPVQTGLIDHLMAEYNDCRRRIDDLAEIMVGTARLGGVLAYFIEGNAGKEALHRSIYIDRLFQKERAIKALDSDFWSKALHLTDVLDFMPQKRRDAWHRQLTAWQDHHHKPGQKPEEDLPPFEETIVRDTLVDLMASRHKFFAERVDGIFRSLSGDHVTNQPEGFGKRMIINHVTNDHGYSDSSRCGYINDLRAVIARFSDRPEPKHYATGGVVDAARKNHGQWMIIDGGALRIRCYKIGTAHLEVHPDMAWRLNMMLHSLYPTAIPAQFRARPPKKTKAFAVLQRPLPYEVTHMLSKMKQPSRRVPGTPEWNARYEHVPGALGFEGCSSDSKGVRAEAERTIEAIGGVKSEEGWFMFDYEALPVIREIVCSGCIPDQKSHQYYPTQEKVATEAVEEAQIEPHHSVCEPSAGTGGIAQYLPKDRTVCVEISKLHCAVLEAKGFETICADFLTWNPGRLFDRIVMNPPFSEGRAEAHLKHAASLLEPRGRLVAILPMSMRNKDVVPGMQHTWSAPYDNEFKGTSVSVVRLTLVAK